MLGSLYGGSHYVGSMLGALMFGNPGSCKVVYTIFMFSGLGVDWCAVLIM